MKYFVFLVFLFSLAPSYSLEPITSPGDTRINTAKDLLTNCQEMSNLGKGNEEEVLTRMIRSTLCGGYVNGFLEADGLNDIEHTKRSYCLPNKLSDIKLAEAITVYLRKHPEFYQLSPGAAIFSALQASYPCKR